MHVTGADGSKGKYMMYQRRPQDDYTLSMDKRRYLKSRIRVLKRLLEKGGLEEEVEQKEIKKLAALRKELVALDAKITADHTRTEDVSVDDLERKLQRIRRLKNQHARVNRMIKASKADPHADEKERTKLRDKRNNLEESILQLGGLISEDSESLGSFDSVEEDLGKKGFEYTKIFFPSFLKSK